MMMEPIFVLDEYPEIKKRWTCNDIGYLLRLGLIRGKKLKRGCLVYPEDVKKLFDSFLSGPKLSQA